MLHVSLMQRSVGFTALQWGGGGSLSLSRSLIWELNGKAQESLDHNDVRSTALTLYSSMIWIFQTFLIPASHLSLVSKLLCLFILISGTSAARNLQQMLSWSSTTVSSSMKTRQRWEWQDIRWGVSLRAAGRSSTQIRRNRSLRRSPLMVGL